MCPLLDRTMVTWIEREGKKFSGSERNPGYLRDSTHNGETQEFTEQSVHERVYHF